MAISVAIRKRTGLTPTGRTVIADVTFDATYPAGGEPYTAADFGMKSVDFVECQAAKATSTTAWLCLADHTASKLMLFGMAAAAGVGTALTENNTANQSATVVRVKVTGDLPNI